MYPSIVLSKLISRRYILHVPACSDRVDYIERIHLANIHCINGNFSNHSLSFCCLPDHSGHHISRMLAYLLIISYHTDEASQKYIDRILYICYSLICSCPLSMYLSYILQSKRNYSHWGPTLCEL